MMVKILKNNSAFFKSESKNKTSNMNPLKMT